MRLLHTSTIIAQFAAAYGVRLLEYVLDLHYCLDSSIDGFFRDHAFDKDGVGIDCSGTSALEKYGE